MLADIDPALSIHNLLHSRQITTEFQPVFSVRQKSMVGVEALSRGLVPGRSAILPAVLFQLAAAQGLTGRFDELCREEALRRFTALTDRADDLILFLNLDLRGMEDPDSLALALRQLVMSADLPPSHVAIEIVEAEIGDVGRVRGLASLLRACGFLIVLDDVGAGHSNLDRIPVIQPDILKVDRTLISQIDKDFHKRETLKSLVSLSRRIGALVVAEGVETEREAIVSLELGADLLQGYFLCEPREDGAVQGDARTAAAAHVDCLARRFKDYMVDKINERKVQHKRLNVIMDQILCQLAQAHVDQFEGSLRTIIQQQSNVECLYVLDQAGIQVTDMICSKTHPQRTGGVLFRPATKGADHALKEYFYLLLNVGLQKYTTDPYVSLVSGYRCRTISTCFRDARADQVYVLCMDAVWE